jgi:prepilin-type N-terminal cleavage/methylation domain-containing protein
VIKLKSQSVREKAFTLIELMAVVIILGIITTITVTSINYSIKRSRDRLYVQQVQRLKEGVRTWAIKNTETLPIDETGIVFFSVSRLKDEGIVDTEEVMDPRTNQELAGCMTIRYDDDFQQYAYEYEDMDCSLVSNSYMPIINVTGGDNQFVEVNGVFSFPLVTALDYNGRSIRAVGPIIYDLDDNVLTSIDKSVVGTKYRLEYKATDDLLNLTQIRNVELTVQDTIPPVITCEGKTTSHTINFEASPTFTFPTCIVSDNSCGTTGIETGFNSCTSTLTPVVTTNIIANTPGTYNLEYSATDSSLNTRFLIISVNVEDTTAPTQPTFEYKLNTSAGADYNGDWTSEDVWIGNFSSTDLGTGIMKYQYATGASCDTPTPTWVDIPGGNDFILVNSSVDTQYCISTLDYSNNRSEKSISRIVRVDKTAPSTPTLTVNESWTNAANVSGTIGGSIDSESGILRYEYSLSGATTLGWTTGTSFTISNAGQTTINVRTINNAGLISLTTTKVVQIDRTAPTCASSGGSTTWTNGNRTLTGTCSDTGGSGCSGNASTTYSTNTNTTTASPGTVTDVAGNSVVCPANQTVRIDKTAPTCTSSGGSTTWTNGNRTLTGTCSDTGGSGCVGNASTTYSTNTNTTTASPGTVSDVAGNSVTCPANQTVRIDKTAPTCSSSGGSTTWTNGNRTLTGTCSDTGGSGCVGNATITYSTNTNVTNVSPGTVTDVAGNSVVCPANQTVRIDKTAPTCSSSGGSTTWTNGNRTLTGTCSDTGGSGCSGNASTTYSTNTNTTTASPGTVTDVAGNSVVCPANQTVRIDKTAPTCTSSGGSTTWTNGNRTLTGTCSDTGGSGCVGNASTTYSTNTNTTTASPGTVSDVAGNSVTCPANQTVRIDKTAPSLTFSRNGSTTYSLSQCTTPSYSDTGGSGINTGSALYVWSSATSGVTPSYSMPSGSSRCYSSTTTTIRLHGRVCDNAGNCTQLYTGEGISGAPQVFYVDVEAPSWVATPTKPTCVRYTTISPCGFSYMYRLTYLNRLATDSRSGLRAVRVTFGGSSSTSTSFGTWHTSNTYITSGTITRVWAEDTLLNRSGTGTNVTSVSCSSGGSTSVCSN